MASGIVRGAITAVVEKTPSSSSRSCKLRKWAQEVLDKAHQGDAEMEDFDQFSTDILKYFSEVISSVTNRYKLSSSKREHLWRVFHLSCAKGEPPQLWMKLTTKWGLKIDDCLLEQSLYQELFEVSLKKHFVIADNSGSTEISTSDVELSVDELNVMRYVGGYVARQLLRRYEHKSGELYSQYITCLGEMAVAGEGDDLLSYTTKWMEKVNRGGLFPINNNAFHLFIEMEKCVRVYLPKHLTKSMSDEDTFQHRVHNRE